MLHHIAWFSGAPVAPHATEGLTSPDPVVERRCLIPARTLEKLGLACSVFGNLEDADPTHVAGHLQKLGVDVVVIGKVSPATLLRLARTAKHLGCYVIADFADEESLPPALNELVGITDLMIGATEDLAHKIISTCGIQTAVIPDCDTSEDADSLHSPEVVARLWQECFKVLKQHPPACANSNQPQA